MVGLCVAGRDLNKTIECMHLRSSLRNNPNTAVTPFYKNHYFSIFEVHVPKDLLWKYFFKWGISTFSTCLTFVTVINPCKYTNSIQLCRVSFMSGQRLLFLNLHSLEKGSPIMIYSALLSRLARYIQGCL